jgi:hypothetical protein
VLQTSCYAFEKPQWLSRIVGEIAGTGLLFAEGDEHKKQRRLLAGKIDMILAASKQYLIVSAK